MSQPDAAADLSSRPLRSPRSAASVSPSLSRRRSSSHSRASRSQSGRLRAASALSSRSDSSTISSGTARVDWLSGDAYDYVDSGQGQISAFLHCPICLGPFYDPHVSDQCSHTFCKRCIATALAGPQRSGNHDHDQGGGSSSDDGQDPSPYLKSNRCPSCRTHVRLDDFKPTALLIRNMVDTLQVRCPNRQKGCQYTCERHLLRAHVAKDCEYEYVDEDQNEGRKCRCSSKVMRKDWKDHGLVCPKRKVSCEACQAQVSADELEHHCKTCSPEPATCNFCGQQSTKSMLSLHLNSCPDAPTPCPHAQYGCDWIGPRWQLDPELTDLEDPPGGRRARHLSICRYEGFKAFFAIFSQQTAELERENAALRQRLEEVEDRQRSSERRVEDCIHSLGSWYRSAGNVSSMSSSTSTTANRAAGEMAAVVVNAPAFTAEWEEFPLGAGNWEQAVAHRPGAPSLSNLDRLARRQSDDRIARNLAFSSASPMPPFAAGHRGLRDAAHHPAIPLQPSTTSRSAPSSTLDAPFPAAAYMPSPDPSLHPPIDPTTNTLSTLLATLQTDISTLSTALASLERRHEESHLTAVSASFEAGRATEETASLRHVVHAVRMQIHQILMQQQRVALFSPPAPAPAPSFFGQSGGDAAASSLSVAAAAGSGQSSEQAHAPQQPGRLGYNPPMLVRRWAGLDQTKL
ncbi:hypothetical protein ACQY0O_000460 [Thecaphora frezii]